MAVNVAPLAQRPKVVQGVGAAFVDGLDVVNLKLPGFPAPAATPAAATKYLDTHPPPFTLARPIVCHESL